MIAKVFGKELLSDDIYSVTLRLDNSLGSKPGQFVLLAGGGFSNKAYSIVKEDDNLITLGIKKQNGFSKFLSDINIGENLNLLGPFGSFTPRDGKRVVLVGGGIGVTPLISLYSHYKDLGVDVKVLLSSNNDFVFLNYFDNPLLFDTSKGRRISPEDVDKDSLVYICGPPKMIRSMRSGLLDLDFKQENIFSEEFVGESL